MEEETSEGITYPSGEIDLKRRVAGEILNLFEGLGEWPTDDELTEMIERVFADIKKNNLQKIDAGRPINVPAEVKRRLQKR